VYHVTTVLQLYSRRVNKILLYLIYVIFMSHVSGKEMVCKTLLGKCLSNLIALVVISNGTHAVTFCWSRVLYF